MGEGVRAIDEPTTVKVGKSEEDSDVIFNTVPGETKIQFGIDANLAKELGFSTNKFYGTIGGFTVDDAHLPLWSFSQSNQACEGDFAAPVTASTGHIFRYLISLLFNGENKIGKWGRVNK